MGSGHRGLSRDPRQRHQFLFRMVAGRRIHLQISVARQPRRELPGRPGADPVDVRARIRRLLGGDTDGDRGTVSPDSSITRHRSSDFLLYQTEDGRTRLEVRLEGETVWLSLGQMAELFQ